MVLQIKRLFFFILFLACLLIPSESRAQGTTYQIISGTLANRPTTCSIIGAVDVYVGTDTSKLYICKAANTWGTGIPLDTPTGSGTVNSGTAGQFAYYASSTTAVSGQSTLIISGTEIGLGQPTPAAKLDILGDAGVAIVNIAGTQPSAQTVSAGTVAGSALSLTGATGGNTSSTTANTNAGGGGSVAITAGAGGNQTGASSGTARGGTGGTFTLTSGAGGNATSATGTVRGGTAGGFNLVGGTGGTSLTTIGGTGGAVAVNGGVGGVASAAAASGSGGGITISAGAGAANSTSGGTAGSGGNISLDAGAAGTASGGASSGTAGTIAIGTGFASSTTMGNNAAPTTIAGNALSLTKVTSYNGTVTAGDGVPAIYGAGRSTAQTGAVATVTSFTVGAADGSFIVSANVNITAFTAGTFNVNVAYTDETNTARTLKLSFSTVTGTIGIALAAAGPFEGIPAHIRCKAATAITISTSGTFTTLTYNVEGVIQQVQ